MSGCAPGNSFLDSFLRLRDRLHIHSLNPTFRVNSLANSKRKTSLKSEPTVLRFNASLVQPAQRLFKHFTPERVNRISVLDPVIERLPYRPSSASQRNPNIVFSCLDLPPSITDCDVVKGFEMILSPSTSVNSMTGSPELIREITKFLSTSRGRSDAE